MRPREDWERTRWLAQYLFGSPANAFRPEEFFIMPTQPTSETYVIGKPTDDCDGILIARTDEAGNVSVKIA